MRRPRYLDFKCPTCETMHKRFVETNDDDTPLAVNDDGPIPPEVCGENMMDYEGTTCDGVLVQIDTKFQGYMRTIVKGSHDYNERERARLEKRADEHWRREGKDEAIDRERALFKKHGMEGVGGLK